MKWVQTSIFAMMAFFLSAGISFGAELDDLDVTIRVVESDDLQEMQNELSLPAAIAENEREHAEGDERKDRNESGEHDGKHDDVNESKDEHDGRHEDRETHDEARDEREDELEDHDEAREDDDDMNESHDEAHEEETHEEEHEKEGGAS